MLSARKSIHYALGALAALWISLTLQDAVHAGSVAGWGRGIEGQLGHGMRELVRDPATGAVLSTRGSVPLSPNQPVLVDLPEAIGISQEDAAYFSSLGIERDDIKQLSAGREHCLLLTSSGRIYAWGNSTRKLGRGRLGDAPSPADRLYPTVIPSERFENRKILQVAAGDFHSLAVDDTGQVWGWGDNSSGQLGTDGIAADSRTRLWEAAPRVTPTIQKESVILPTKLCVRHPKTNAVIPLKVPSSILQRAASPQFVSPQRPFIAAGERHSLIIAEANGVSSPWCVYALGDNTNGQTTSSSGQPALILFDGVPISPTWVVAGPKSSLAFEDVNFSGDWSLNTGQRAIGWGDNSHRLFGEPARLTVPTAILPPAALTSGNKNIPIEEIYISYSHTLTRIKRQPFHTTVEEQVIVTGSPDVQAAKPPNISSVILASDDSTSLTRQTISAAAGNGNFNAVAVSRVAVIEANYKSGRFIVSDSDRRKSGAAYVVPGTKVSGNGIKPNTVITSVEYEQTDTASALPRVLSFSVSNPPVVDQLTSSIELRAESAEGHSLIAQGVDEVHSVHAVIINGSIQVNSAVMTVTPTALEHYGFAVDQAQLGGATSTSTTDSVSGQMYSNTLTGNRSKVSPIFPGMKVYGTSIVPGTTVKQVLPNDGIIILSNPVSSTLSPAVSSTAFTALTGGSIARLKTTSAAQLWNFNAWFQSRRPSSDFGTGFTPPVFSFDAGPTTIDSQAKLTESGFLFVPPDTVVLRSVECDNSSPFGLRAIPVDTTAPLVKGMQIASLPHPLSFIGDKNPQATLTRNQLDTNDLFSLEKLTGFDIGALSPNTEDIPTGTRINPRIRVVDFNQSETDGTTQLVISHRINGTYPAPGYQNKGVLIAFKHTPVIAGDTLAGAGIPQGSVVKPASYISDSGTNLGDRSQVSPFFDHSDFVKSLTNGQNTIIHSVVKLTPPPSASPGVAKDSGNVLVTRSPPTQILAWGDNSIGQLGDGGSSQGVATAESPTLVRTENALSGFDTTALVAGRNFMFAISPNTNNDSYRGRWDVTNDKMFRNELSTPTDATVPLRLFSRIDFSHQPNPVTTDSGMLTLSAEIKGRYNFESLYRYDSASDSYVQDVTQPFQYPPLPSPQGADSPAQYEPVTWVWYHVKNNRTSVIDLKFNNINNQRGTQTISTVLTASTTIVDLVNYSQPYFTGLNRSSNLISLTRDEIDTERNRPLTKLWSATPFQTNRDGGAQLPGETEITSSSRLSWRGPNTDMDVSGEYFAIAIIRDGRGNSFRVQSERVLVQSTPISPMTQDLVGLDGQTKRLTVETDATSSILSSPVVTTSPKASYQWFTRDFDSGPDDFKPVRNGGASELPVTFTAGLASYYKCRITDSANVWESTPALVWSIPRVANASLSRDAYADPTPGATVTFITTINHTLPIALKLARNNSLPAEPSRWRQNRSTMIPLESLLSDSPQNEDLGLFFRRGYVLEAVIPIEKVSSDDNDAEFMVSEARRVLRQIVVRKSQSSSTPPTYTVSLVKAGPGTLEDDPTQEPEEPPVSETLFLNYPNPNKPNQTLTVPLEIGSTLQNLTASDLKAAKLQWNLEFPAQLVADYEDSIAPRYPISTGFNQPDYQNYIVNVYSFDSKHSSDVIPLIRDMVPTVFPTDRSILQTRVQFTAEVPPETSPAYGTFFGDLTLDQRHINPKRLSTVARATSEPIFLASSDGLPPSIEPSAARTPIEGQPLTLRMTTSAAPKSRFQWYKQVAGSSELMPVPGANSERLQIPALKSSDSATYYVSVQNPEDSVPTYSEGFDLRVIPLSTFAGDYSMLATRTEPALESDDTLTARLGRISLSILPSGAFSGKSAYRGYTDSLSGSFFRGSETTLSVSNRRAARRYLVNLAISSEADTPSPQSGDLDETVGLELVRNDRVGGSELRSQYVLPGESVALSVSGHSSTPRWKLNGVEINPQGTHASLFSQGILEFSNSKQNLIIKSMTKGASGNYQVFTSDGGTTVSPAVPVLITVPTLTGSIAELEGSESSRELTATFSGSRMPRPKDPLFQSVLESPKLATALMEGGSPTVGSNSRPVDGYMTFTTALSTGLTSFTGKLSSGETFSGTAPVASVDDNVPVLPVYSEFRSTNSRAVNWTSGYLSLPSSSGPRSASVNQPSLQTFFANPKGRITGLTTLSNSLFLSARISETDLFPFLPPVSNALPIFRTPEGLEDLGIYLWGLSKNASESDSPTHLSAQPTLSGVMIDPPNQQRMTLKINRLTGIVSGSGINPTATRRDASSILRFEGVTSTSGADGPNARSTAAGFFKYGSTTTPSIGRWEVNPEN